MTAIWNALVPDRNRALEEHLDAILTDLVDGGHMKPAVGDTRTAKSAGPRRRVWLTLRSCNPWRIGSGASARPGARGGRGSGGDPAALTRCVSLASGSRGRRSALALADLLHGRDVSTLTTSFEDIWKMSLRVLDDIKVGPAATCARRVPRLALALTRRQGHPDDHGRSAGIGPHGRRHAVPHAGRDHRPRVRSRAGKRAPGWGPGSPPPRPAQADGTAAEPANCHASLQTIQRGQTERLLETVVPFLLDRGVFSDAEVAPAGLRTVTLGAAAAVLIHAARVASPVAAAAAAQDVRRLSLDTLCKLCQRSGKRIKPYVANIVATLLEALSALEPQALNYLSFHVDKFDLTHDQVCLGGGFGAGGLPLGHMP